MKKQKLHTLDLSAIRKKFYKMSYGKRYFFNIPTYFDFVMRQFELNCAELPFKCRAWIAPGEDRGKYYARVSITAHLKRPVEATKNGRAYYANTRKYNLITYYTDSQKITLEASELLDSYYEAINFLYWVLQYLKRMEV